MINLEVQVIAEDEPVEPYLVVLEMFEGNFIQPVELCLGILLERLEYLSSVKPVNS